MLTPAVALASLSIRDFRGIDSLDLDFRGPDGLPNRLVVLAGPNGSGKTAVLEAAVLAAGGSRLLTGPIGKRAIRKGANDYAIMAEFFCEQPELEHRISITSHANPANTSIPHWYFSSWRAPALIGPVDVSVGKAGRKPVKNDANRLKNVKQLLVNAVAVARFRNQSQLFPDYDRWMQRINESWSEFYPAPHGGHFLVDLAEENGEPGGSFDLYYERADGIRLEVDYLSAGQLELLLFLAALVLNNEREGIVFIDEPELHLDPLWHRAIVRSLIRLQPRAQFIVATHSPEIYDAAASYERHFLVPKDDPRSHLWQPVINRA